MWKKTLTLIFCFLLTGICFVSGLFGVAPTVYAADVAYSNVLDDLRKDSNFDESYYVENEKDYGLSVITLAESTDNDLYVYVFQPTADKNVFLATHINIWVNNDLSPEVEHFGLQCVSSDGGFFKYKVLDFVIPTTDTRAYEVISIFRPWIKGVDEEPSGDNKVSEKAFGVGRIFTFSNGGQYSLTVEDSVILDLKSQFVGFLRLSAGGWSSISFRNDPNIIDNPVDCHFIAFSSRFRIDELLEASVLYSYDKRCPDGLHEIKENQVAVLDYRDSFVLQGSGLGSTSYEWDLIQTKDEFLQSFGTISSDSLLGIFNVEKVNTSSDTLKENLKDKDWVLRFLVTDYVNNISLSHGSGGDKWTTVYDVSILRLKFETDGKIYNLGAVSNKQTGSGKPDNDTEWKVTVEEWVKWFFLILGLILLGVLLSPFLTILKFLWSIIKIVLDVVFAPFRWIFGIGRSRRRRK